MIVLRSEQYHKKMNLVGDLASYACWAVHLRTPQLDVGVIAIRRKFIPPIGDTYQVSGFNWTARPIQASPGRDGALRRRVARLARRGTTAKDSVALVSYAAGYFLDFTRRRRDRRPNHIHVWARTSGRYAFTPRTSPLCTRIS